MPLLALAAAPMMLGAQHSADVAVPIRLVIPPTLVIRSVVVGAARTTSSDATVATAIVNVESNLPYRLSVRLAEAPMDARVLLRGADGTFEPLDRGASLVAVARGRPGHQSHEIVCRVEGPAPNGCALVYELSAEYHDTLIRASATLPVAFGLRPAAQRPRDASVLMAASRGP